VEGLERHRGSFEKLLEDCGSRKATLREQIDLIEKCEVGMEKAEADIREMAIDAIAAVRKRERQMMTDLRDSIGELALGFMSEKATLLENLRNVESTFNMTEEMLKGTSIELLMAKKEMQERLNNILQFKIQNAPESLKKSMKIGSNDCYENILASMTFASSAEQKLQETCILENRAKPITTSVEVQTETIVSSKTFASQTEIVEYKNSETETDKIEEEINKNIDKTAITGMEHHEDFEDLYVSSEKELEVTTPVEEISPVEYITPITKDKTGSNGEEFSDEANDNNVKTPTSSGTISPPPSAQIGVHSRTNLAQSWQKNCKRRSSLAKSLESAHITPPPTPTTGAVKFIKGLFGLAENTNVNSSPVSDVSTSSVLSSKFQRMHLQQSALPIMVSTGTEMEQIIFQHNSTSMSSVTFADKETATPNVVMTNKAAWTENMGMVDKTTMTAVDVTAAYRNVASSRRLVTVSRGTCTPRTMFPLTDGGTAAAGWFNQAQALKGLTNLDPDQCSEELLQTNETSQNNQIPIDSHNEPKNEEMTPGSGSQETGAQQRIQSNNGHRRVNSASQEFQVQNRQGQIVIQNNPSGKHEQIHPNFNEPNVGHESQSIQPNGAKGLQKITPTSQEQSLIQGINRLIQATQAQAMTPNSQEQNLIQGINRLIHASQGNTMTGNNQGLISGNQLLGNRDMAPVGQINGNQVPLQANQEQVNQGPSTIIQRNANQGSIQTKTVQNTLSAQSNFGRGSERATQPSYGSDNQRMAPGNQGQGNQMSAVSQGQASLGLNQAQINPGLMQVNQGQTNPGLLQTNHVQESVVVNRGTLEQGNQGQSRNRIQINAAGQVQAQCSNAPKQTAAQNSQSQGQLSGIQGQTTGETTVQTTGQIPTQTAGQIAGQIAIQTSGLGLTKNHPFGTQRRLSQGQMPGNLNQGQGQSNQLQGQVSVTQRQGQQIGQAKQPSQIEATKVDQALGQNNQEQGQLSNHQRKSSQGQIPATVRQGHTEAQISQSQGQGACMQRQGQQGQSQIPSQGANVIKQEQTGNKSCPVASVQQQGQPATQSQTFSMVVQGQQKVQTNPVPPGPGQAVKSNPMQGQAIGMQIVVEQSQTSPPIPGAQRQGDAIIQGQLNGQLLGQGQAVTFGPKQGQTSIIKQGQTMGQNPTQIPTSSRQSQGQNQEQNGQIQGQIPARLGAGQNQNMAMNPSQPQQMIPKEATARSNLNVLVPGQGSQSPTKSK